MIDPQLLEQVQQVISYSQGIQNPKVTELLELWNKNKEYIKQHFLKGQYIYEYPEKITFELDTNTKTERLNSFFHEVHQMCYTCWSEDFSNYLKKITPQEFYDNILQEDFVLRNGKKINKGIKIIKSFKYFIDEEKLLHNIQDKASAIIQEAKVSGYLCFSIHPLDFLSSSENNHNWRSCHSLDGEYRAGNLSYMSDQSTMIVYLRSEEPTQLNHFPQGLLWNDKKWRCLFHFDTNYNVIVAGRQYPFNNPDILEQVREIMLNTIIPVEYNWIGDKFRWSHWHNDQIKNYEYNSHSEDNDNFILSNMFRYVVINGRFQDLNTMVMDSCEEGISPLHFNDLLRSSCYTEPYYMFKKSYNPQPIEIIIGNPIKCVNCENHWITVENTMLCKTCCETLVDEDDLVYSCDCCGCEIRAEDVYWCGEDTLCPSCANLETYICEECGERYYNNNRFYHKETNKFICENCIKYYIEEENDNG